MVSKNNRMKHEQWNANRRPHFGLRKLSVGVASVLLGTTLFWGGTTALADSNGSVTPPNVKTEEQEANTTGQAIQKSSVQLSDQDSTQASATKTAEQPTKEAQSTTVNSGQQQTQSAKVDTTNASDISAQALTESKAETTSNPVLQLLRQKNQELKNLRRETARTVVLNKPTGQETIKQYVRVRTGQGTTQPQNPNLSGDIAYGIGVSYGELINNKFQNPKEKRYTIVIDPNTNKIVAGQDQYDAFKNLQRTDLTVDLSAVDQSQINVDGYVWWISSASPEGTGITAEAYTLGGPQTVTIDYKKVAVTYNFVDQNNNVVGTATKEAITPTGQVGSTYTFTTDDTNKFNAVPAGYELVGNFPTSVTIPDADETLTIPVKKQEVKTIVTYQFVDQDNNGQAVGNPTTVSGVSGSSQSVQLSIPANYELASGQTLPTTAQFSDNNQAVKIGLKHKTTTTTTPVTITRKITITQPGQQPDKQTQSATFQKTDTKDLVTNTTKTSYDKNSQTLPSITVPSVAGYTPTQASVPAIMVKPGDASTEVNITYTANPQNTSIIYKDGDTTVKTDPLNGVTDQTVDVTTNVPAGYKVINQSQIPSTYKFKASDNDPITVQLDHQTTTVTPGDPKTPSDKLPDNPGKNYPTGVAHDDLNKTITRKITVTKPDGSQESHDQTTTLTRIATVDEATGKVTKYSDWTTDHFDEYDAPSIAGYTPNKNAPAVDVNSNSNFTPVEISYTANPQNTSIIYKDGDTTVKTDPLNGVTDQTVNVTTNVPAGYKVINQSQIPSTYKFKASDNDPITVQLGHQTTTVQPTNPKTPSDKLPDNPGKNYPSGVDKDDLNKTITRTITVTKPDGSKIDASQKVTLTRTATVDEATGKVTKYSDWTTDHFDEYDAPAIPGYTPTKNAPKVTTVDVNYQDPKIEISYTPNKQSSSIIYKDGDTTVKTDPLNGVTDQTVDVTTNVPAGYKIVDPTKVPSTYKFKASGNDPITVPLEHMTTTVQPTDPKTPSDKLPDNPGKSYPTGVSHDDLNKTITRKITVTKPDSSQESHDQTTTLTRTATVDEVNGNVTYSNWTTDQFSEYDAPAIPGYTPTSNAPKVDVTSNSNFKPVDISYTANPQNTSVIYKDGDKTVKTDPLNGVTDQTVDVKPDVPTGYKIVDSTKVPSTYTFHASGNESITIQLEHQTTTVTPTDPKTPSDPLPDNPGKNYPTGVSHDDLNKTITRQITVIKPDGSQESHDQTITLTRTATVDEVTGKVTYGEWTTGQFPEYDAPAIPGYTPTGNAPAVNVTSDSIFSPVVISYVRNAQPGVDHNGLSANAEGLVQGSAKSSVRVTTSGQSTTATNAKQSLPQTGNQKNEQTAVAGLLIAGLSSIFGLAGFRKKNEN